MSKYLVDKFLFTIDRDPELVERYRAEPERTVAWWEANRAGKLLNATSAEATTWLAFTDAERAALSNHDQVALFEMGAHPFLTLTLWIAMFERDHPEPLAMQLDYAAKLRSRCFAVPRHHHLRTNGRQSSGTTAIKSPRRAAVR